jgi:glycosyltransferase involved in cell wall biosynthesis
MKVCYFGTYEKNYPLNSIIIKGLRRNGVEVAECHVSLWEKYKNKHGNFLKLFSLFKLLIALMFAYLVLCLKFLSKYKDIDIIVVGYIGQLDIFLLRLLTFLVRKRPKIVFIPLVSLYDTAVVDRGLLEKDSIFAGILFYIDKFSFKMSDLIILDTNEHIKYVCDLFNLDEDKFKRVWVGADEDVFYPMELKLSKKTGHSELTCHLEPVLNLFQGQVLFRGSFNSAGLACFKFFEQVIKRIKVAYGYIRQMLRQIQHDKKSGSIIDERDNASSRFTVLFFGKYIPLHGLEYIIKAAELLKGEKDIKFEMIGNGQLYDKMVKLSKNLSVKNIEFVEWVKYDNLASKINKADVVIGIFGGTDKSLRVIPNKVFQAVACGKPVITGDSPAIRELFTDKENILLCKNRDPQSLKNAILKLRDNKDLRNKISNNSYEIFKKNLDSINIGKAIINGIKNI